VPLQPVLSGKDHEANLATVTALDRPVGALLVVEVVLVEVIGLVRLLAHFAVAAFEVFLDHGGVEQKLLIADEASVSHLAQDLGRAVLLEAVGVHLVLGGQVRLQDVLAADNLVANVASELAFVAPLQAGASLG